MDHEFSVDGDFCLQGKVGEPEEFFDVEDSAECFLLAHF